MVGCRSRVDKAKLVTNTRVTLDMTTLTIMRALPREVRGRGGGRLLRGASAALLFLQRMVERARAEGAAPVPVPRQGAQACVHVSACMRTRASVWTAPRCVAAPALAKGCTRSNSKPRGDPCKAGEFPPAGCQHAQTHAQTSLAWASCPRKRARLNANHTQVDPMVFNMVNEDPGKVDYSSIGGLGEQIRELRESIELPLMNPELFLRVGIKPPKGARRPAGEGALCWACVWRPGGDAGVGQGHAAARKRARPSSVSVLMHLRHMRAPTPA